ncbi:hypothetical protein [Cytobacillus horneckiae]|uniref:hypothetical protein n=1 Tax=Cytobacillus horneckiae TaxID=549687 RepID=UPI003D23CD6D
MEQYEYYNFPKKYWRDHDICWYLHDLMLSIFHECLDEESGNKLHVKIEENGRRSLTELQDSDDTIEWLRENGYLKEANLLLKKKSFHAILADFLGYIYESLETSMKGKTAISYTLLRKPFKDNLFYLEWLLFDGDELINLIDENKLKEYEVGSLRKTNRKKMKDIIRNAYYVNEFRSSILGSDIKWDFFYEVRYDYNKANSLELIWNKANHLVTTAPQIKSIDFNNIFLEEEDYINRWDYYYTKLPLLLLYSLGVVLKLYDKLIEKIPEDTKQYNEIFIATKWFSRINDQTARNYIEEIISIIGNLPFNCNNCGNEVLINDKRINALLNDAGFNCDGCNEFIFFARYQFVEINSN